MTNQFYTDLEKAKAAEVLVCNVLSSLDTSRNYELVGAERQYFYKGDIKATDKKGNEIFIEVKDDSRIAETYNVLCEEEVYYKQHDYYGKGNMQSDYDIYAVVSKQQRKIYVIDFKCLQQIYRKGEYKEIQHPQQTTYCYLLNLGTIKKLGGLIATLDY